MTDFLITRKNNKLITGAFLDLRLTDIYAYDESSSCKVGDIYVGRIQNIVKNINAAFVNINKDTVCYLDLNEAENAIFSKKQSSKKISMGDELVVEVSKEGIKTKAPVVSCNFSLSGKYVSISHGAKGVHVSKKITSKAEKDRLVGIFDEFDCKGAGIILRTNAENMDAGAILKEATELTERYVEIVEQARHFSAYTEIYKAEPEYFKSLRDTNRYTIDSVVTDCKDIFDDLSKSKFFPDIASLRLFTPEELNTTFKVDKHLSDALKKTVYLKSGASLVIEQTEALTSIDVNTGKAIAGKSDVQNTFFRINCEACKEIAYQMRARNLSGIIIIDFINMEDRSLQDELLKLLREEFKNDPVKAEVVDITKLGLVEVTRKKVYKSLAQQMM